MFSVIMSTYNAPRELDLALCGLSRQSREPDELLIADDGSSEATSDVIASWSKKWEESADISAILTAAIEKRAFSTKP